MLSKRSGARPEPIAGILRGSALPFLPSRAAAPRTRYGLPGGVGVYGRIVGEVDLIGAVRPLSRPSVVRHEIYSLRR